MQDPELAEEWLARRAAWREDWDAVSAYVNEASLLSRMRDIMKSDNPNPHSLILALGVYTSYGIEFKDIQHQKEIWTEGIAFMKQVAPQLIDDAIEYWRSSVLVFYGGSKSLDPKDFGLP